MQELIHPADADVWDQRLVPSVELSHRVLGRLVKLREQVPQVVCPVRIRPPSSPMAFSVLLNGEVNQLLDRQSSLICDEVLERLFETAVRGGDHRPVLSDVGTGIQLVDNRLAFQSLLGPSVRCEKALDLFQPRSFRHRHLREVAPMSAALPPILLVQSVTTSRASSRTSGIYGNERPPYPPQCRGCAERRVGLDSRSEAAQPDEDPTTLAGKIAAEPMGNLPPSVSTMEPNSVSRTCASGVFCGSSWAQSTRPRRRRRQYSHSR